MLMISFLSLIRSRITASEQFALELHIQCVMSVQLYIHFAKMNMPATKTYMPNYELFTHVKCVSKHVN